MNKVIYLGMVLSLTLIIGGCSLTNVNQSKNQLPSASNESVVAPESSSSTPGIESSIINIENFAFNPQSLTIKKGATVTWTNSDSAPHQIKGLGVDSALLSTGQSFSFTFNTIGTFNYYCSVHPSMKGAIIVN